MTAFALRLLLCLALLLEGIAPAIASTHLAMAQLPVTAPPATMHDCGHDMSVDDAPAVAATPDSDARNDAEDDSKDCLRICLDLCLQHSPALASLPLALALAMPGQPDARASHDPLHPRPGFPPLRPPIA